MKQWKKFFALLLSCSLMLSLCACSGVAEKMANTLTEIQMAALVQGNLDQLYRGIADEEYLKTTNSTEAESQQVYEEMMAYKAEDFAYYFLIEFLTDDLRAEITELCKEIFSKASYTVGSGTVIDDTTVSVTVEVQPIDIYQQMVDDLDSYMADFYAKYPEDVIAAMDDAAYAAYDAEWARLVIDLCREKLQTLGHGESRTLALQVALENDVWCMTDQTLIGFDTLVILYP